jgi:hypothetical protein
MFPKPIFRTGGMIQKSVLFTSRKRTMESSKSQALSSREAPMTKPPNLAHTRQLVLGAWSFSGTWSLGFEAFPSPVLSGQKLVVGLFTM